MNLTKLQSVVFVKITVTYNGFAKLTSIHTWTKNYNS